MPRGIDLHGQSSFGEVHLNLMCAFSRSAAFFVFMLIQEIVDELLARIISNALGWVHQTQGRRRYHCLLYWHVRVAHGDIQVTVRVPPVTERAACEPRHAAVMAVGERNCKAIRGRVRKPMHAVSEEIVILLLFPVRNDRGACGFKPLNGVSNRIFIERSEVRILTVAHCDLLDQINRSRDAANWLGGYRDWRRLGHTYGLTTSLESIIDLTLLGINRITVSSSYEPNADDDAMPLLIAPGWSAIRK